MDMLLNITAAFLLLLPVLFFFGIILVEALIIKAFKIKLFIKAFQQSIIVNSFSLFAAIVAMPFLKMLGYQITLTNMPLPVISFLCWLAIVIEGLVLILLNRNIPRSKIFIASIAMNIVSHILFYIFIFS